jgi:hypothetical protein
MDKWITVIVAVIVALSTLGGAFLQNWFSHKRFKAELGRTIDVENRKRKWEVRSEPLLKLRAELAVMATKQEKLAAVSSTYLDLFGSSDTEEIQKTSKELKEARDNWETYLASENLMKILFLQSDNEFVDKVEDVLKTYNKVYSFFEHYWERASYIEPDDDAAWKEAEANLEKYREAFGENRTKAIEVQELINKKLEEL